MKHRLVQEERNDELKNISPLIIVCLNEENYTWKLKNICGIWQIGKG